jgi:hypothetical protein
VWILLAKALIYDAMEEAIMKNCEIPVCNINSPLVFPSLQLAVRSVLHPRMFMFPRSVLSIPPPLSLCLWPVKILGYLHIRSDLMIVLHALEK